MKKIISLAIAFLMIFSVSVTSFAAESDSADFEKYIKIVKGRITVDDDAYVFDDYRKSDNSVTLVWKSKDEENYGTIRVTIDSDEDITSFSGDTNEENPQSYDISKRLSDEKLKELAAEFAKKMAPKKSEHFKAEKVNVRRYEKNLDATVNFVRYENGIEVSDSSMSVEMNAYTGEVTYYNMFFKEFSEIESNENLIGIEKAREFYKDKLGYELTYFVKRQNDGKTESFLAYSPKKGSYYSIDAKTGDLFSRSVIFREFQNSKAEDAAASDAGNGAALKKEEQATLEEIKALPSKDEITSKIKGITEFNISDKYELSEFNIYKCDGDYIARAEFDYRVKETDGNYKYFYKSVEYNLTTSKIVSFSGNNDAANDKGDIKSEILKKTCSDFADKYYSDIKNSLTSVEDENKNGIYLRRCENGIGVQGEGLNISADSKTGEITSVRFSWSKTEFAKPNPQKTLADLYEKILSDDNFKLVYATKTNDDNTKKDIAKLVYTLKSNEIYSPDTLEKLNYDRTQKVTKEFTGYTDIENHYVKDYAIALGNIGIYFDENTLKPDEAVTQKDFLAILGKAMHSSDSDGRLYKYAEIEYLDGDKLDDNAFVSRISAIRYIINGKGYKTIAKMNNVFKKIFSDVPEDLTGYASLGAGFKIVSDKADKLNYNDNLTRAEALVMIYNLINN